MKKILIFITTYNRPGLLLELVKQIHSQAESYQIQFFIVNDKSSCSYAIANRTIFRLYPNTQYYMMKENMGKKHFWRIFQFAYAKMKAMKFDYMVQLQDDIGLTPNFFNRAIEMYESIKDPKMACLNIRNETSRNGKSLWTPVKSQPVNIAGVAMNKIGWVDCVFMCTAFLLNKLKYTFYPVDLHFSSNPKLSSGVGMQMSQRIVNLGLNIYQPQKSLITHGHIESVMHPEERKRVPLISNHQLVTASMAAIPSRTEALKEVVDSLLPQVDQLRVYLNEFTAVPKFLSHDKITVFRSQDHLGDLGDVGKFYRCEDINGYHFTVDDDIIYPKNYVDAMIASIEQYGRKYAISCHGRIFGKLPVTTYYRGHTEAFSYLLPLLRDRFVHVCGTGVLAYHTDTIRMKLADFPRSNMADIWFSKRANKLNVQILVIKHHKGWFKVSAKSDENYSIYTACNRKDEFQTKITNETPWKQLKTI